MKRIIPASLYMLLCLLFGHHLLPAQGVYSTAVQGPVSPSAAAMSFGKYADTPVNPSTGTMAVSVPICNLSEGPLSHAVSISYHTGGIRVSEIASSVGLGWNLNAGGVISRTVRGLPDDHNSTGYWYEGRNLVGPLQAPQAENVADGILDAEPDLFFYNVNGMSGKFMFDKDNNVHLIPKADIKIIPRIQSFSSFRGFELITSDGTIYEFGTDFSTSWEGVQRKKVGSQNQYNETWFLKSITSFDGKHQILFDYLPNTYKYKVNNECYLTKYYDGGQETGTDNCDGGQTDIEIDGWILSKITTSTKTVDFLIADRYDLLQSSGGTGKRVDRIDVNNGTSCVYFELDQSYFSDAPVTNNLRKRLRLNSIQKKSCDPNNSDIEEPYTFTYHNNSSFFPHLLSKAIDHWGYYNGQTQNDSKDDIIPYSSIRTLTGNHLLSHGSSNRNTNGLTMLSGTLQRITYPTKGYTEFTYEANTYLKTDNNEQQLLFLQTCNEANDATTCCNSSGPQASTTRLIDQSMIDNGMLYLTLQNETYYPGCSGTFRSVQVTLYDETNGDSYAGGFSTNISGYGTETVSQPLDNFINMTAGHVYRFELSGYKARGTVEVRFTPDYLNVEAGGLRIQKIKTHDGLDSGNDIVRTFEYEQAGTDKTSGVLTNQMSYAVLVNFHTALFASTGVLSMSNSEGYHLTYTRVKEKLNGNGYKEYLLDTETYSANQIPDYPARPGQFLVRNGVLKESKAFNQNGNLESSQQVTGYGVEPWEYDNIPGIMYAAVNVKKYSGSTTYNSYTTAQYGMRTNVFRPQNVINTQDGVTTTTTYTYHPQDKVLSPTVVSFTNSDGKMQETRTRYTVDYYNNSMKNLLIDRHMIDIPYETKTYVDGVQVDGHRIYFSNYSSSGVRVTTMLPTDFPRPYYTKRYEQTWTNGVLQTGTWRKQETFKEYNADGLLSRHQKINWKDSYYYYNSNKLLTRKLYENHDELFQYYPNSSLLERRTAVDGTTTTYSYDGLMRLKNQWEDCVGIRTTYTYFITSDLSVNKNYIQVEEDYPARPNSDVDILRTRTYLDGLGRTIQSVRHQQSPFGKDLLVSTEYNAYGKVNYQYNQLESDYSDMRYISPTSSWKKTTYEYYSAPSNRLYRTRPEGWYWTYHFYGHNDSNDLVKKDGTSTNYATQTLFKKTTQDGSGRKHQTFTDLKGRIILSRQVDQAETASKRLDTYTVYDDKDRISYVLPPDVPTVAMAYDDLYYRYEYSDDDELVKKKVPGAEEVLYKYNYRDQLSGYQDGLLRAQSKWYTYTFDDYGRELSQGLYNGTPSTDYTPTDPLITTTYGTNSFDKDKIKTTQVKVLNSSDWLTSTNNYSSCGILTDQSANNHINLSAGSLTNAFEYDGAFNVTKTTTTAAVFRANKTVVNTQTYDAVGRPYLGYFKVDDGPDQLINKLHYNEEEELDYKFQGRTGLSGKLAYLQRIDYTYTDFGALQSINANQLTGGQQAHESCTPPAPPQPGLNYGKRDLFYLELYYDTPLSGTDAQSQKNGNVANAVWQVRGREQGVYSYQYDDYNRLTQARYYDRQGSTLTQSDRYTANYQYDKRGNLTKLTRNGMFDTDGCTNIGQIDSLAYTYYTDSNQPQQIEDAAPSGSSAEGFEDGTTANYQYDANGNLSHHPDRGITITYNHLNLPSSIVFDGTGRYIDFTYDAAGKLLRKEAYSGTFLNEQRDYIAGMEYVKYHNGFSEIDVIHHAEGRVTFPQGASPRYEYSIRDHLGNTRLIYTDLDGNGHVDFPAEIIWEGHYYPFGMEMKGPWMRQAITTSQYTYNGIEKLDDHGLDVNMAQYRVLDPAIGRWWQVDPEAESFRNVNPYNSMLNNPGLHIDPKGDHPIIVGMVVSVIVNGAVNVAKGENFYKGALQAAIIGGISGGAGSLIGGVAKGLAATWPKVAVAAFKAGSKAVVGGALSVAQGEKFWKGAIEAGLSSAMGSGISAVGGGDFAQWVGGGVSKGLSSAISGESFLSGFAKGLLSGAIKQAAYNAEKDIKAAKIEKMWDGIRKDMYQKIEDYYDEEYIGNATQGGFGASGGALGFGSGAAGPGYSGPNVGNKYPQGGVTEGQKGGSYTGRSAYNVQSFKQSFARSLAWSAQGVGTPTVVTVGSVNLSPAIRGSGPIMSNSN